MQMPMLKVDNPKNRGEVTFCRELGVDHLGISVSGDSTLGMIRLMTEDDLSDVFLRFDLREITEDECAKICHQHRPWGVDFVGHFIPNKTTCLFLQEEGFQILFSNIEASYDTDPSWILSRYQELWNLNDPLFQLDLLEQTGDAWRILRDEVSDNFGELTIADINSLSTKHSLILNLNFTNNNVCEICETFPNIRGISFSLQQHSFRRWYSPQEIASILHSVQ